MKIYRIKLIKCRILIRKTRIRIPNLREVFRTIRLITIKVRIKYFL